MMARGNGENHGKSVEHVYDQLRDAILDGELVAGSSMSQARGLTSQRRRTIDGGLSPIGVFTSSSRHPPASASVTS
jgi:hypothetical protein